MGLSSQSELAVPSTGDDQKNRKHQARGDMSSGPTWTACETDMFKEGLLRQRSDLALTVTLIPV